MNNLRGNHTSLIPLAEEIVKYLSKEIKTLEFSPGLIVRKGIKIKEVSVVLKDEITSILMTVLMKGSKQFVRIYFKGPASPAPSHFSQLSKSLENFCKQKNILFKNKS